MREQRPHRARLRRLLCLGAIVLLGLEGLYLLGANLFLNTGMAPWALNRKPEKFRMDWQRAWSVIPGRVHLRGVRLRAQSRPVQWYVEAGQARISLRLLRLGFKHVSAHDTELRDVDFRLRGRGVATRADTDCALQPPIPGFTCGPGGSPELGPKPTSKRPWTFTFSGLTATDIHALWLDRFRYEGLATAAGSFTFAIRGPFHMDNASAHVSPGTLHVGDRQVTAALQLDAKAQFKPFLPQETQAREVLRYLSGNLSLDTERSDLGFLTHIARGTTWLNIGGEGRVHGSLDIANGTLTTASRLDVDDAQVQLAFLDFTVVGDGGIHARVVREGEALWTKLTASVDQYALSNGPDSPLVEGTNLTLEARSPDQDLTTPVPVLESTIDVPLATVPDLRQLNAYWPPDSGFRFNGGSGLVGGRLSLSTDQRSGHGNVHFASENAEWSVADTSLRGQVSLRAQLADADPTRRHFRLGTTQLDITTDPIAAKPRRKPPEPWNTRVMIHRGDVRLAQPLEVNAAFEAEVSDSRPLVAMLAARKPLLRWLRPLLTIEDIDLTGRLHLNETSIHLADLGLTSDGLDAQADLRLVGPSPEGHVLVSLGPLTAAVALAGGERDWKLTGARKWYAARVPSAPDMRQ